MMVNVFSMKTDKSVQITPHFKVSEFACKDKSDVVFVDNELVRILEEVREHFNKPVHITSGYRTVSYNIRIGGASYSKHCRGMASDIYINGVRPKDIYDFVNTNYPDTLGLGLYKSFVHIDTRIKKTRWKG